MNIAEVMDDLAVQLTVIDGLRVFEYPPGSLVPPAAVVAYPDEILFDSSYQRGADRLTIPIMVMVGKANDRSSRDRLGIYADGRGSASIKQVIETGRYKAFGSVRVTRATVDVVTMAGTDYLAAVFSLDIIGKGQ